MGKLSPRISNMQLNGVGVTDAATYRVSINNLATGGDGFTVFTQGTDLLNGVTDLEALEAYFLAASPVSPPATARITRVP